MRKVAIITDSTAYIPQDIIEKYHITVVPQVLIWGDEIFEDGVDILPNEFYQRLQKSTIHPSTSQVTIASFQKVFPPLLDEGCDVLAILLSEKLSGTIDSAVQAREMLGRGPIEIVDSQTTSMALGLIVIMTARAAEQGASLAECKALAEKATQHVGVVFAVNTLEFLHRGGRIGGGSRFLGTALNIKPILEVVDGRVEAVERVRTRNKSLQRIIDITEERIGGRQPVYLAVLHGNALSEAEQILALATEQLNPVETFISGVSPVIGTHAGPGVVGLAYMAGI